MKVMDALVSITEKNYISNIVKALTMPPRGDIGLHQKTHHGL